MLAYSKHGIVSIPRKFHEDWLRISDQYVSCALALYLNALCARFGNTSAPKVHMHTYLCTGSSKTFLILLPKL